MNRPRRQWQRFPETARTRRRSGNRRSRARGWTNGPFTWFPYGSGGLPFLGVVKGADIAMQMRTAASFLEGGGSELDRVGVESEVSGGDLLAG